MTPYCSLADAFAAQEHVSGTAFDSTPWEMVHNVDMIFEMLVAWKVSTDQKLMPPPSKSTFMFFPCLI